MNDALLSSEFQSFRTPPEFLETVRRFAPIALDPATDEDNPVGAKRYFTCLAIQRNWVDAVEPGELAYCNPPYGRSLLPFSKKFAEQGALGLELLTLTPGRFDTKWWRNMRTANAICFLYGRIKFWSPVTEAAIGTPWESQIGKWLPGAWNKKKSCWSNAAAPFPCAVSYWGKRVDDFVSVFSPLGWCVRP
jgi:hypothetical protein